MKKRLKKVTSLVVVLALMIQIVNPAFSVWAAAPKKFAVVSPLVEDGQTIPEGFHRIHLHPTAESGTMLPMGGRLYVITGQSTEEVPIYQVIYTEQEVLTLDLPEGEYFIRVNSHHIQEFDDSYPLPTYYITSHLSITSQTEEELYFQMGGPHLSFDSFITFKTSVNDFYIPAISVYPKGETEASVLYIQKKDRDPRKVYISPGEYTIIAALSNDENTYFLEKDITILENQPYTLNFDNTFTSTITKDNDSYEKGETVSFTHEILDSYENRLISKANGISIGENPVDQSWNEEISLIQIYNAQNELAGTATNDQSNEDIFGAWNGWAWDTTNESISLVEKPNRDTIYFNGTYSIPVDITGGIFHAKTELGAGEHTLVQTPINFIIAGDISEPVLNPIPSPTNAASISIEGTAAPGSLVDIYYKYGNEEKVRIDSVTASTVTGEFSLTFEPGEEGTYHFTANNSIPKTVTFDWTKPNVPVDLEGKSTDSSSIDLSWKQPPGEEISKYEVYRNGIIVSSGTETSFTDTGLFNNVEYKYQVIAVDLAGNKSDAAQVTLFTKAEDVPLQITSVNWTGSWDARNHLNMGANILVRILGTPDKTALVEMEFIDSSDQLQKSIIELAELKKEDGSGAGTYVGSIPFPAGAKMIKNITGFIQQGENKVDMVAGNLPVPVNGAVTVALSDSTMEKIDELKGAELSIWSKSKNSGKKMIISSEESYSLTGLVPSEDYTLKVSLDTYHFVTINNISVQGGGISEITVDVDKSPATLNIRLLDEDGVRIPGSSVTITNQEGVLVGHTVSDNDGWVRNLSGLKGETLRAQAQVPWQYTEYYVPSVIKAITFVEGINNVDITLEKRPMATISGTARTMEGDILANADVFVYTNFGDYELNRYVRTDADGKYSLEVYAGKIRMTVMHPLSRTQEYDLGNISKDENKEYDIFFQVEKKVIVNIKSKKVGEQDYYSYNVVDFNTNIIIKNKGTPEHPKDDSITTPKGDTIYFAVPNAEPDDVIEITADGTRAGYGKTSVTATLDENSWAKVDINLEEQGRIKATFVDHSNDLIDYPVFASIYKVNDQGEAIFVKTNTGYSGQLITSGLEAGTYNVIFHSKTPYYTYTYDNILEYLGDDAIIVDGLHVVEGEILYIGEHTISQFEESGWTYFNGQEGNSLRSSMMEVSPGSLVTITANYNYEVNTEDAGLWNLGLYLDIPNGSTYVEDSVVINHLDSRDIPVSKPKAYYIESKGRVDTIHVPLGGTNLGGMRLTDIEGSITYQVRFSEDPIGSSSAAKFWAEFKSTAGNEIETIDAVEMKVPFVSIYSIPNIFERTIPVSGQAPKNAVVKIYDSSYYLGEVKADHHGLWRATVTLPNRGEPASHFLYASAEHEASGATIASDVLRLTYDTDQPKITKIMFGQTGRFKKEVKQASTVRYDIDQNINHEMDVYFDDSSRIQDFQLLSGSGEIVVKKDDIRYDANEDKFSATWTRPIVQDEIRTSYTLKPSIAKLSDYQPVEEDVMRSSLPDLWRTAEVQNVSAREVQDIENDTIKISSEVLLGDKNSKVKTTMEIKNYDGELPEGASFDDDLPVWDLDIQFSEDGNSFEMSFLMPRDVLLSEVEDNSMNIMGVRSAAVIGRLAMRTPAQLVRVFGQKTAIEAGLDVYSLVDTFTGANAAASHLRMIEKLAQQIESPCYTKFFTYEDENAIRQAHNNTKERFVAKSLLSIAFLGLAFVPVVGWGAIALAVGTTVAGFAVDQTIDYYQQKEYETIKNRIDSRMKPNCKYPKNPNDPYDDKSDPGIKPRPVGVIDPSGYVYEAVESNRVEGVTTTAFEKVDDSWVFWDAEWFAQENPLFTNKVGFYQWDVPEGLWKVMYEKEGYYTTFSDELPVPPPQLEVNIPIVSMHAPTVEVIPEHTGTIKLLFDKYMDVSTINTDTFKLYETTLDDTGNKVSISGTITALDAEVSPQDAAIYFAREFRFTPETPLHIGDTCNVWVSEMVTNYAGRTMVAEVEQSNITIPEKPKDPDPEPGDDHDNGGGSGSIGNPTVVKERKLQTISYDAKPSENTNGLVVYGKDEKGNLTLVKASFYDPTTKTMNFYAETGSEYVVGYLDIGFKDIDMWAKDSIIYLAARGIIDGVGENRFEPQRNITRAEFIKLLVGTLEDVNLEQYTNISFDDVTSHDWYSKYIEWAVQKNIVQGYDDGSFGPNDPITREQMAVMLHNFVKAMNLKFIPENQEMTFNDQDKISNWAESAIQAMQKAGIVNGDEAGNYNPRGNTTRAEATKVIAELLKQQF